MTGRRGTHSRPDHARGAKQDDLSMPNAEFGRWPTDVAGIQMLRGPAGTAQGRFSPTGSIFGRIRQPASAGIGGPRVRDRRVARA